MLKNIKINFVPTVIAIIIFILAIYAIISEPEQRQKHNEQLNYAIYQISNTQKCIYNIIFQKNDSGNYSLLRDANNMPTECE